jgi:protein-disulfide isomerase
VGLGSSLSEERPDDHARGPEDAPLVVVYADFTCPRCAVAHARLQELRVRRVFRHLALKAKHPRAVAVACAAEAAAAQDAFWAFHDALYADQGRQEDPHLWELAGRLGLDVARFEADRRSPEALARVERDTREAVRAGAMTTPTLYHEGEEVDLARLDSASFGTTEEAKTRPSTDEWAEGKTE